MLMDRSTVDRRDLSLRDTDESVDRLLVMLTAPVSGSPLSSLKMSGKLSRRGNWSAEL